MREGFFETTPGRVVFYILLLLLLVVQLFPIYIIISSSFQQDMHIWSTMSPFEIVEFTLENYEHVIFERPFLSRMRVSFIVALFTTVFAVSVGSLASYGFARYRFRGNDSLSMGVLATRMIPPITLSVPFFMLMSRLELLDTYRGLIIAHTSFIIPFVIWLTMPFFEKIPQSFEDAALIDGCNRFQAFYKVFLPMVAPGLVVAAMFSFLFSWNDFIYALILGSSRMQTAPVAVSGFVGQFGPQWGPLMAAGTLVIIPVFAFAMFMQKYLIEGLTAGGLD